VPSCREAILVARTVCHSEDAAAKESPRHPRADRQDGEWGQQHPGEPHRYFKEIKHGIYEQRPSRANSPGDAAAGDRADTECGRTDGQGDGAPVMLARKQRGDQLVRRVHKQDEQHSAEQHRPEPDGVGDGMPSVPQLCEVAGSTAVGLVRWPGTGHEEPADRRSAPFVLPRQKPSLIHRWIEAKRHGRREIAENGDAAGKDQNALRARHWPIVSFKFVLSARPTPVTVRCRVTPPQL
jgi:hypothetical protein